MTTPSTATATSWPNRETVVLMPEATPVSPSGAGLRAVEVMAGTVAVRPREKTSKGGKTSVQ